MGRVTYLRLRSVMRDQAMVPYFDTSAINWVLDNDPILPQALRAQGMVVHISAYNLLEIAATPDVERRVALARLCRELSWDYRPLEMPQKLLRRSLRAWLDGETLIEPSVPADHGAWGIICDPEILRDEKARSVARDDQENAERDFRRMHESARPDVQRELAKPGERGKYPDGLSFIRSLAMNREFLNDFFERIFDDMGCPDARGRAHEALCQVRPWGGYFAGHAHAIFDRAMRTTGFGHKRHPGSVDLAQLIYFANASHFVTDDGPLREVAKSISSLFPPTKVIGPVALKNSSLSESM